MSGPKIMAFQPLVDDVPYHICHNDDVRKLEESELQKAINELRNELQDMEITKGIKRPVSSVKPPKDINHFRLERDHAMRSSLQVCQPRPITLQKDLMSEEIGLIPDDPLQSDYTPASLPLLLYQFFADRMWQLVQSRHLHMLRWKRFCDNTKVIEMMYPAYRERLLQIRKEYDDCVERAERLSLAREYHLAKKESPVQKVEVSDLIIYLQWLISHHHSMKKFSCYAKVLQWLPLLHKEDFELQKEDIVKVEDQVENITARYKNMTSDETSFQSKSVFITSPEEQPPHPPLKNPFLRTTSCVSLSQLGQTTSESSGGGLASDEQTQDIPFIYNDTDKFREQLVFLVHLYKIGFDVESMRNSAQEMELYAGVVRKFRKIYCSQQRMKTFKRYDAVDVAHDNWGADSCTEALKQESNWLKYVKLKPEKNLEIERRLTDLRNNQRVDGLLEAFSRFALVSDPDRVNEIVKQHAEAAKNPPNILSVDIRYHLERSGKKTYTTVDLWKIIYTSNDLFGRETDEKDSEDDQEIEAKDPTLRPRSSSSRKRRSSYDFKDAVNLLGLEDPDDEETESNNMQGAYLSYLLLRQLRIRDLQRTCLSIFNYFRSIERTLTINDGGLSLEGGKVKQTSPQKHRRGVNDKDASGFVGNIGCHDYIHNTPKDFKIREVEFMEFEELENHDDFYSMEEGRVHVRDQKGYYVMYDSAISDLRKREKDLVLIASHYLEKNRNKKSEGLGVTSSGSKIEAGNFSVDELGQAHADRFGILLDLWSNEAAFLESKKQLVDAYFEAYLHVFDRDEKRLMAQTITNVFYRQPRLDFDANYFVKSYRLECVCLRMEAQLTKSVLDAQIEDQRNFILKFGRKDAFDYGLPNNNPQKCPVSVNLSRSALKNIYLLEFHPSLAIASRLPIALSHAYWELHNVHQPRTATEELVLHRRLLGVAQNKWDNMQLDHVGSDDPIRKELFSEEVAIEDPHVMKKLMIMMIQQTQESGSMRKQKDNTSAVVAAGKVLDMVTMRYRLMEAVFESDILAQIYGKQASSMGHGPNHLHLGPPIEAKPDPRLSNVMSPIVDGTEDIILESFTPRPGNFNLAIHELDNTDVGRLLFGGELHMEQLIQKSGSLENLQTTLMCQLVHRNTLMTAVQMSEAYQVSLDLPKKLSQLSDHKDCEKPESSEEKKAPPLQFSSYGSAQAKRHPFFSVHLAKKLLRDKTLAELGRKKDPNKKQDEMEKIKRGLFRSYCNQLQQLQAEYSMRGQMMSYYNSILALLGQFPDLRKEHFMIGEPFEAYLATLEDLDIEPGKISPRPRSLTTEDGRHVLNLWYIPHSTSLMTMFRSKKGRLSEDLCRGVLQSCLRIVAALHDILQYLCALAGMGSVDKSKGDGPFADHWGGTKEIVSELIHLQRQADHLEIRGKPDVVKIAEFLVLRRDVMLMQFDATVRLAMTETFLVTNNAQAYKGLKDCMHFGLHELSNASKPALGAMLLNVPEPLNPDDIKSKLLFPWRSFINRNGPYGTHFWPWYLLGKWIQLCLAGLKDADRQVANGELLGVALLLQDVVSSVTLEDLSLSDNISSRPSSRSSIHDSRPPSSLALIRKSKEKVAKKPLSKLENPVESYQVMKRFLLLWKRLEVCKYNWGLHRLSLYDIPTPEVYGQFAQEYRSEVLWPVMKRHGHAPLLSEDDVFHLPNGVSEMDIRKEQMMKVLEAWECQMILQVKKKIVKETNLARVEHNSIEVSLPTVDAWKRQVIKDNFTIERPRIAEDFIIQLMQETEDSGTTLTVTKDHLTSCLNDLSRNIMARERFSYDSYSMHYENLLRIYHRRLYQKEQEIKQVQDQYEDLQDNLQVETQCLLADNCHDLLLEVTALRSKVKEMSTSLVEQDSRARDKVRQEYSSLIKDLFSLCVHLQQELDSYRITLYSDIRAKIKDTKEKGLADIVIQKRNALALETDEDELQRTKDTLEAEGRLKAENHQLSIQLSQLKAEKSRTDNEKHFHLQNTERQLQKETQDKKIFEERLRMRFEKRLLLAKQQLEVLRGTFKDSIKQSLLVKADLNKELKVKKDKLHAAQQSAQSQMQLEKARKADYEKRLGSLEKEEARLRLIVNDQEKERRLHSMKQDKIKKEVSSIKKRMNHERSLKLEAFHRVDDLQTMVYDAESSTGHQSSRPQTALTAGSRTKSRAHSAAVRVYTSAAVSGGVWPPPVSWPINRSLTPGPGTPPDLLNSDKKVQRPKTTMGRLRNRIAEQLLDEFDPPEHQETVIKLRELQQLREKTFITT